MKITVVTPTLNAIAYLRECIESTQKNQSHEIDVEHVIVDGGSKDGTVELAESYGLRVIKGADKGIFDAINIGSFNSSGELLGFLGADDVMLEGGLEAIARAYRETGKRWVVGKILWINDRDEVLGDLAAPPDWLTVRSYVCLDWNPIMHMATYFTREFFTELGGFNPDYKHSGDFEMFARALAAAPYAKTTKHIACFRRTGSNNSVVNSAPAKKESESIRNTFGPMSTIERTFWRLVLKIWFNLGSPAWFARKTLESVRWRLNLQEKRHF